MSEEEMNQELSTDELKDVSGGFLCGATTNSVSTTGSGKAQAKWANRLTTNGEFNKGRKGKYTDKGATCADY